MSSIPSDPQETVLATSAVFDAGLPPRAAVACPIQVATVTADGAALTYLGSDPAGAASVLSSAPV